MAIDVRVPTTGNAGEDAVVVEWAVEEGASVAAGDVLVTLETAKSTIEVEAPSSGVLLCVLNAAGDEVPEHQVIAVIGEPGEKLDGGSAPAGSAPASAAASPEKAVANSEATDAAAPPAKPAGTESTSSTAATAAAVSTDRIAASPRARRMAERNSIDLNTLQGTGPGGRIIVPDVIGAKQTRGFSLDPASGLAASAAGAGAPAAVPAASGPSGPAAASTGVAPDEVEIVPVRGARKVTARRMHESLQNTAQVTITRYASADRMLGYVARLREVSERRNQQGQPGQPSPRIGVNDALLFATARAVAKHPEANSWFEGETIRRFRDVHLGFAVDTGQALLVPVIRRADSLTLAEISAQAKAAIESSRAGTLSTDAMAGGTFTVSNLGGLGVHWFTPVLNPPQSCILGVGATHQLHESGPKLLPLSLTFDHRAINGAAAAVLLGDIAAAIEDIDVLAAL